MRHGAKSHCERERAGLLDFAGLLRAGGGSGDLHFSSAATAEAAAIWEAMEFCIERWNMIRSFLV